MIWKFSESFAGVGAWGKAIKRVSERHGDDCELQFYYEIDKYASNAFAAIHGISESLNKWDITEEPDELPQVDIFFYSPPCQTFSIAGRREGTTVDKGNLFYNAVQKIEKSNPKYCIMENVKGLVSGDTHEDFLNMIWYLEKKGYHNYYQVLNSKDYGIPQNRERVFIVSVRNDLYEQGKRFEFPKLIELEKSMHDHLDVDIADKYFLSQKMIDALVFKDNDFKGEFKPKEITDKIANCLDTREGGRRTNNFIRQDNVMKITSNTVKGYEIAEPGDSINFAFPESKTRRGRVGKKVAQTIDTGCTVGYFDGSIIRRLKPIECFRLQGFDDTDYYKAVESYDKKFGKNKDGSSKSDAQMYMRAGNSITVNVIEELLENLLYDRKQDEQQISLF